MPNYFGYNSSLFAPSSVIRFYNNTYVAKRLKYYRNVRKTAIPKNTTGVSYYIGIGNTQSPTIITPPASEYKDPNKIKAAYLNANVARLLLNTYPWDTKIKVRDNLITFVREPMTGQQAFQNWYRASKLDKDQSLSKWQKVLEHLRSNPELYAKDFFTWEEFAILEKVITDAYKS